MTNDRTMAVQVAAAAALVMTEVLRGQRTLPDALREARASLSTVDGALLQDICYGTARYYPRLCVVADALLTKPSRQLHISVLCLLYTGLYRLSETRAPDHAVVDLCVRAARELGQSWACPLVNAVLRKFTRQRDELPKQLMEHEAYRYIHPAEFIDRMRAEWPEDWQEILAAGNERPPAHLRVNRRRMQRDDYLAQLRTSDIEADPLPHCPEGVRLMEPLPVGRIPGFNDGIVSVQDGGAQQVAHWLDCQPGQRVLDACAAPGGKAAHLLEITDGMELVCLDQKKTRIAKAKEDCIRLGMDRSATWRQGDARHPDTWWDGKPFDHILIDAPCSATGIIRRQPDIKTGNSMQRLADICMTQQEMLWALWPLIKPGGMLSYVTCSVLADENDEQMDAFLKRQPEARAINNGCPWMRQSRHGRQILPGMHGMDGFYRARLSKSGT